MIKLTTGSSLNLKATLGVDLTGQTVSFVFAPINPSSQGGDGTVSLDLTGGGGQTRVATILDAAAGVVQYTLTMADTAVAGDYRAQFRFGDSLYPQTGFILFTVQDFYAPSSFSALTDFCEPIRAIMGDFRTPYKYEDSALASVVRSVVRMGKVPGYAISSDGLSITPALTQPCSLAMVSYQSALMLLGPNIGGFQWASRALKIRRGDQTFFLRELQNMVYYLENPAAITSFQTYYAWVNSIVGINVWGLLTEMKVQGPVATVTLGTGGMDVSTT
jgi:hypothetical protein